MGYRTIKPVVIDSGGSLAANFTGNPFSIEGYIRSCLEILVTGTPVGQLNVQASNDYVPNQPSPFPIYSLNNEILPPTWYDIPLGLPALTGTGAYNYMIDFTETGIPWLRVTYTSTSGTGNVTTVITAKEF
jgi:hypothetical protein